MNTPKHASPQLSPARRVGAAIALGAISALCWAAVPSLPTAAPGGVEHAAVIKGVPSVATAVAHSWVPKRHLG